MDATQILQIIQDVVLGLSVVLTVAAFIYGKMKGSSSKFLTKFIGLLDELGTSVEYAEQLAKMTPEGRKEFATHLVSTYCANNKIKINDQQLDTIVERIVKMTNIVNAKERPETIIDDLTKDNELVKDSTSTDTGLSEDKADNT